MSATQPSFTLPTIPESVRLLLPPLPLIHDPRVATQARTHKSWAGLPTNLGEDLSYKRLEHAGDVIISNALEAVMLAVMPQLSVGDLTALQGQLKSNKILAQLSAHYGLPDLIICAAPQRHTLVKNETTQAELLEAHIGGLLTGGAITTINTSPSASILTLGDDAFEHITPQISREGARVPGCAPYLSAWSCARSLPWAFGQLYAHQSHLNSLGSDYPGTQALVPANSVATMTRQDIDRHAVGARQCVNQYFDTPGRGTFDYWTEGVVSPFTGAYKVALPDGDVLIERDQRQKKQYALAAAAYRMSRRLGIIAPPH